MVNSGLRGWLSVAMAALAIGLGCFLAWGSGDGDAKPLAGGGGEASSAAPPLIRSGEAGEDRASAAGAKQEPRASGSTTSPTAMRGIVVDIEYTAIEGVRVAAVDVPGLFTTTDRWGQFTLDRGTREPIFVELSHPKFVAVFATIRPGREVELRLGPGVGMRGRLLLELASGEHEALGNRSFLARRVEPRGGPEVAVATGPAGEFELAVARGATVRVQVSIAGRAPWIEDVQIPGAALNRDIVVAARTIPVEVLVVDRAAGRPVPGARVSCSGSAVGETDEAGRIEVPVYADQWHELRASHAGFVDRTDRVRLDAAVPPPTVELELFREATFAGHVVDDAGGDVAGARVELVVARAGMGRKIVLGIDGAKTGVLTTTDAAGAFAFDNLGTNHGRSRVKVVVRAAGYARFESDWVDVPNGSAGGPLTCELDSGARILGSVKANGQPVRATVSIEGLRESVRTDDAGAFVIEGVAAGPLVLRTHLDASPGVKKRVDVQVPASGDLLLDVTLDHTFEVLQGTVASTEGTPVGGVEVFAELATFRRNHPQRFGTRTDSSGFYSLQVPLQADVPDQRYTLRLLRWEEDCSTDGIRPPATVDLECLAVGTVVFSAVDGKTGGDPGYVDVLWYAAGGEESEAFVCESRRELDGSRIAVFVPAGEGVLAMFNYRFQEWRRTTTVVAGDTLDVGVAQLVRLEDD
ncbi:MAG: carboxypeptidase regulatory-like domain-containing protein [bacterium]|nr:carboxypeptidase regulatory-like domain-containing protein [bacterium]